MRWVLVALGCLAFYTLTSRAEFATVNDSTQGQIASAETVTVKPFFNEIAQAQDFIPNETLMVTNFDNDPAEAERWRRVNDNVMGGISQGQMVLTENGTGLFQGTLSLENNGGFSSVRRRSQDADLSAATKLSARVKGDGRQYQLRIRIRDTGDLTYRAQFDTVAGEWQTVEFDFESFEPVYRGRIVADAPPLNPADIEEIGFLIADGKAGEFKLEADWIRATE